MSIETKLDLLTEALNRNSEALEAVLAAGGVIPTNVIPITETPKPAPKGKAKPATTPAPDETPEEVTETPTKVAAPAPASNEFHDELDPSTTVVVKGTPAAPEIDPEAVISQITSTWKTMLTAADAERKNLLKDKFPELREKWGLAADAKLLSLADRPENLVGLLEDIKAL